MTATEVAFSMVALMQAMLALIWLAGGWWARDTRRASAHWAAYAASSAVSFAFLMLAMRSAESQRAELLRAVGNVAGVFSIMALHSGVWVFLDRPVRAWMQSALFAAVLVVAWVGLDPAQGALRVGFNSTVMAWLCVDIAAALYLHARDRLRFRMPAVLALPVVLAALAYAARGLKALADPATVNAEMVTHSSLNLSAVFTYVVLMLAFHAMLMVLVVARLFEALHRLSQRDGLTGLLNRRAMQEALELQWRRSRRGGEVFAVMMLDIDHFKAVNDRHGHAMGDQALKHVSALLQNEMRDVDRLARFGGEEFLVLLPGLSQNNALAVAERVCRRVASTPLAPMAPGAAPIALSISIGVAQWNGESEELSRLLVRADAALYQAKQGGRDRVAVAQPHAAGAQLMTG